MIVQSPLYYNSLALSRASSPLYGCILSSRLAEQIQSRQADFRVFDILLKLPTTTPMHLLLVGSQTKEISYNDFLKSTIITAVIAMFAHAVVVAMKQRSNLTSLLVIGNYNFRASKTITSLTRALPPNPLQKSMSLVAQNMLLVISSGRGKPCHK